MSRLLALAPLVLTALLAACGPGAPPMEGLWHLDLERAQEAAAASGLPMLVVFR